MKIELELEIENEVGQGPWANVWLVAGGRRRMVASFALNKEYAGGVEEAALTVTAEAFRFALQESSL